MNINFLAKSFTRVLVPGMLLAISAISAMAINVYGYVRNASTSDISYVEVTNTTYGWVYGIDGISNTSNGARYYKNGAQQYPPFNPSQASWRVRVWTHNGRFGEAYFNTGSNTPFWADVKAPDIWVN